MTKKQFLVLYLTNINSSTIKSSHCNFKPITFPSYDVFQRYTTVFQNHHSCWMSVPAELLLLFSKIETLFVKIRERKKELYILQLYLLFFTKYLTYSDAIPKYETLAYYYNIFKHGTNFIPWLLLEYFGYD